MTDTREEFEGLFSLYWPILVATTAVVFLVVFFALVRYRRRPARSVSRRSEARLVEVLFGVLLTGVVVVLVTATFRTEGRVDAVAASSGLEVRVTAFKWGWRFTYPESGVSVVGNQERPPAAAVPIGLTVRFVLRSRDVIHSFWVPDVRFKRDAFSEFDNTFDLVFARPGSYVGRCAEFCGLHHAGMSFQLVAMSQDEFWAWLAERRAES